MQDSKFWRIVSVLGVMAVFYVGHGLHKGDSGAPSLSNTAYAGGVAGGILYTSNQFGDQVSIWKVDEFGKVTYRATVRTDSADQKK